MSQNIANNNENLEDNINVLSNPSNTRKRKRSNTVNTTTTASTSQSLEPRTKQKKPSKKLTKNESTLIANAYKYHNGNYSKVYKDPNIVKLKKTDQQIYNHIQYLKNKKNKALSTGRSDEAREDVLDGIVDSNPEGVDGMEETLNSYVASSDDETDGEVYETPLTPELPSNLQPIHDQDKSELDDSINSESVNSVSDYNNYSQKITDRQKIRNAKIRQKEKERNTILEDIREQKQERKEATDIKQLILLSILQQQQMNQAIMMKLFAIPPSTSSPDMNGQNMLNLLADTITQPNHSHNIQL